MENVRGLYWPQQGMSEGKFSFTTHRLDNRLHLRMRNPLLSGCLLRLPPDHDARVSPGCDFIHHPYDLYCYITMPFSLKNAGATYQRCMKQCFTNQIYSLDQPDQVKRPKPTIAIYVDDIVVKMAQACDLIANLAATLTNLQRFNIKLNLKKCVFGVLKGKLLGYIMSEHGIKANPEKIMAISNMGPTCNVKAYKGSPAVWPP